MKCLDEIIKLVEKQENKQCNCLFSLGDTLAKLRLCANNTRLIVIDLDTDCEIINVSDGQTIESNEMVFIEWLWYKMRLAEK